MSYQTDKISYALSKQVADMDSGFSIQTNYGEISVDAAEGAAIINATRKLLERKLAKAQKLEELQRQLDRARGVQ